MRAVPSGGMFMHGAAGLPHTVVVSYNVDVRERGEVLNHRLRRAAFFEALDHVRSVGDAALAADPFGASVSAEIAQEEFDRILMSRGKRANVLLSAAIDLFAADIAKIASRFVKTRKWSGVERLVIGGGFREGRLAERCIRRARKILKEKKLTIDVRPIRHHPHDAGLIGAAHLVPAWVLRGHTSMLAVDIGGTNLRVGVLKLNLGRAPDLSECRVWQSDIWRHAEDAPKRTETVDGLLHTLEHFVRRARDSRIALAPLIGIGCPGVINPDGSILRGAMNLPGGNWESERFNLPEAVKQGIGRIGGHEVVAVMHNDAVLQGLSQRPWMNDVKRWGVLTIGTGLGNASFETRGGD